MESYQLQHLDTQLTPSIFPSRFLGIHGIPMMRYVLIMQVSRYFTRLQVQNFKIFICNSLTIRVKNSMKFNLMATGWRVRRGIPRTDISYSERSWTPCSKLPTGTCTHFDLFISSWNSSSLQTMRMRKIN